MKLDTTRRVSTSASNLVDNYIKKVLDYREADNFDVFEGRVLSLLNRWKVFKEDNIEKEGIAEDCIKYALGEINDEYTRALMEKNEDEE